jgi:hypothetical protein
MTPSIRELMIQGLMDALGFLVGSALGWGLGQWLGLDLFEPGYSLGAMVAIAFIGIGGGMGLQAARFWREKKASQLPADSDHDRP